MKEKSLQERWGKEVLTQVEFNSYVKGGWVGGGGGGYMYTVLNLRKRHYKPADDDYYCFLP